MFQHFWQVVEYVVLIHIGYDMAIFGWRWVWRNPAQMQAMLNQIEHHNQQQQEQLDQWQQNLGSWSKVALRLLVITFVMDLILLALNIPLYKDGMRDKWNQSQAEQFIEEVNALFANMTEWWNAPERASQCDFARVL